MSDIQPEGTSPEGGADASRESQPNWRRELEARARAGDEATARVAELERQLAFRDAGINPGGMNDYFMAGYQGEMTAEAIQAEAAKVGLGGSQPATQQTAPTSPQGGEVSVEEAQMRDAAERIAAAQQNADVPGNADLNARIAATQSPEELQALMESEGYAWDAAV